MAVIKGAPKPLPNDDAKDCATGWCDPFDSQFARPTGWGDPQNNQSKSTPKTDHKGQK